MRQRDMSRYNILHGLSRRDFLRYVGAGVTSLAWPRPAGAETLYNGITLARSVATAPPFFPTDPILPPYLAEPPDVIPIDVGRQLFVDDFLIEEHLARRAPTTGPSIIANESRPAADDEVGELRRVRGATHTRSNSAAMVFSDGVSSIPPISMFKMWYMGGYSQNTCYAVSRDGIHVGQAGSLDVVPGTNIVAQHSPRLVDRLARSRRPLAGTRATRWRLVPTISGCGCFDRATAFTGPRRGVTGSGRRSVDVLLQSVSKNVGVQPPRRRSSGLAGSRRYWETADFFGGAHGRRTTPVPWVSADAADPQAAGVRRARSSSTTSTASAYESVLLGLFTIFRGERERARKAERHRASASAATDFTGIGPIAARSSAVSEQIGDWNWANVQSAGGCLPRRWRSACISTSAAGEAGRGRTTREPAAPGWRRFAGTDSHRLPNRTRPPRCDGSGRRLPHRSRRGRCVSPAGSSSSTPTRAGARCRRRCSTSAAA